MTAFEFIVIFNLCCIHFWIFVIAGLINRMIQAKVRRQ